MNDLQLRTGPYRTTLTGTEIIRQSTPDEWKNYGEILKRIDEVKQWAIGDWLCDGKSHYGDGLYEEAEKVLGVPVNTLWKLKNISDKFEICRRRQNLAYAHHVEVASLKQIKEVRGKLGLTDIPDHEKMQEFLSKSEKETWSVRALREAIGIYKRRQQEEIRLANEPERYPVIFADPAWEYDFSRSDSRQIDNHYLPTSLEDMKRLKIPAAKDCVLFVCATNPKLKEALELIEAWQFEYKTNATWVKDKIGMGYYFRQKHELLLLATRGKLQLPDESIRPESTLFAPRTEHSKKPDLFYEIIELMYPKYKKIELFARTQREGWDSWGDEIS